MWILVRRGGLWMESWGAESGGDNNRCWDVIGYGIQGLQMMELMGKESGVWDHIREVGWADGNSEWRGMESVMDVWSG